MRVGGFSEVVLPHLQQSTGTLRAVNARVLIVTQEKPLPAAALVTPQDVEAGVLAAAIVFQALVHIWRREGSALAFVAVSNSAPSPAPRDSC